MSESDERTTGKNAVAGVVGIFQRAREVRCHEVEEIKLQDGKPLAFMYVPFTTADWDAVEMGPYAGLPIFAEGESDPIDNWSLQDKILLRQYYGLVVRHGLRQIRDVENGKTVWRDIEFVPDEVEPSQAKNGKVKLSMAALSAIGVVVELGAAILNDANYGGKLSPYVERGFQHPDVSAVCEDGKFLRMRPHEYLLNRIDVPGEYIDMALLIFDERALFYDYEDQKKSNGPQQ